MPRIDSDISQQRWIPCRNVWNGTIPAYGLLQIVREDVLSVNPPFDTIIGGGIIENGKVVHNVHPVYDAREDFGVLGLLTRFYSEDVGFNSHVPIPPGGKGLFTLDTPALVAPSVDALDMGFGIHAPRNGDTLLPPASLANIEGSELFNVFESIGSIRPGGPWIVIRNWSFPDTGGAL